MLKNWVSPLLLVLGIFFLEGVSSASAQTPGVPKPAPAEAEEDDFKQTPYTRFGEFQTDDEEAEDARFFQFGRFFGFGIGAGYTGATGNRGIIYQGGFPTLEAKVVYWFDFQTSMVLSIMNSKHTFTGQLDDAPSARFDVNIMRIGADFRYYFDTKDLSAPITFSNPYITVGLGNYRKTQTQLGETEGKLEDASFGFALGGGFEFVMQPKKTYFNLEAKIHSVSFNDTGTPVTISGKKIDDTSGLFFTVMGALLFTW